MLKLKTPGWVEKPIQPVNTLQIFITNRCNMRCKGCFYAHKLDNISDMSLEQYKTIVKSYAAYVKKIILLGGEPLLHKQIGDMIIENHKYNISTTIYTNGRNIEILKDLPNIPVEIRIGVFGNTLTEKPLSKIPSITHPVKIVFMLRKDNISELNNVALSAESRFNCQTLYLSSIRDISVTKDYWKDTEETINNEDYALLIQNFMKTEARKPIPSRRLGCAYGARLVL
ncbi:MAG: radical SAM protein [Clostridia bacterium]|jgi:MoaA/NifB/PqqE/SkfB family radical SAM enzyme